MNHQALYDPGSGNLSNLILYYLLFCSFLFSHTGHLAILKTLYASTSVLCTCCVSACKTAPHPSPDIPIAQFLTLSWSLLKYHLPREASLIALCKMAPALLPLPLYLALFSFIALLTTRLVIFKKLDGGS